MTESGFPSTTDAELSSEDPRPADTETAGARPGGVNPVLPVLDLIGLRFALLNLRLVGYGLLAVWLTEVGSMLTEQDLAAISSRLHYISQFLDLSPILLVAIGLIAYQGGLRRRIWELLLLPPLLMLLPLLSAFHFSLAPITVANSVTLVNKQEQVGKDQMERIDRQIDRAAAILRESDDIDGLVAGLQRIPGMRVRLPAKAPLQEARSMVRRSLEQDRQRLRERILRNISSTREAFIRRAVINAVLALLLGLVLWGLHHGSVREMQQSVPYLRWVLAQGDGGQSQEAMRELLRFQRVCLELGWLSLLERSVGMMRRRFGPANPDAEAEAEEERKPEDLRTGAAETLLEPVSYPPPFDPGGLSILARQPPRLIGSPFGDSLDLPYPEQEETGPGEGVERKPAAAARLTERWRSHWGRWQRERQLQQVRTALRRQGQAENPGDNPLALSPGQERARQRDLRRSRRALRRLGDNDFLVMVGEEAPPPPPRPSLPPPKRGPLGRLWHWFVTHL